MHKTGRSPKVATLQVFDAVQEGIAENETGSRCGMETCLKNTANAGAAPATVNKPDLPDATVIHVMGRRQIHGRGTSRPHQLVSPETGLLHKNALRRAVDAIQLNVVVAAWLPLPGQARCLVVFDCRRGAYHLFFMLG